MGTILKLLYAVAISLLLVSCGGNSSAENEVISEKPVSIFAAATSFSFEREDYVISNFTFEKVESPNELMLCNEIMELSGKQAMSFTALEDASDYDGKDFSRKVLGVLVIGRNEFKVEFLFNVKKDNNGVSFTGILTFNGGNILKNDNITLSVKGKQ